MSRLAELLIELSNELLSSGEKERLCRCPSASDFTEDAATISLPGPASFSAPDGSSVKLGPGTYRVDVLAEGYFVLTSLSERHHWVVATSQTWHELRLTSPLALSIPTEGDEQNIMVLFPGGGALLASGPMRRRLPNVIVATGRAASNAPFSTWAPDAQAAFTTAAGTGAPVEFELRVDGFTFATRSCKFNAQFYYPQSPADPTLFCQ